MYEVKAIAIWLNNDLKLKSKKVDDKTNDIEEYRRNLLFKYKEKYHKDIDVDLIYLTID